MRVTYSINARLAGGGMGHTAHQAVRAIYERGWLYRLIVSSSKTHEFDGADVRSLGWIGRGMKRSANYDPTQRLYHWGDVIYDQWAARQISHCDIFHGWDNHSRASLQEAKRRGVRAILERPGSHISQTYDLLCQEFARWGSRQQGILPAVVQRSLRECESSDYIMVPSQYNVDSFLARGFSHARLLLLPLGVDTQRFKPPDPQTAQPPIFRALFIGQVSLRKGIPYLLQAWHQAALPNAELVIAGEIKADAVRALAPYRDDHTIRWLGHVSDPVTFYQSADVFVFPSIDEGSALVTYEAMACGLPVLTTHNSGSLVRDGESGFIVPLCDADTLTEKLCWLHDHPEGRAAMGRTARVAIEPMTWEHYGERLLAYYEQVANS